MNKIILCTALCVILSSTMFGMENEKKSTSSAHENSGTEEVKHRKNNASKRLAAQQKINEKKHATLLAEMRQAIKENPWNAAKNYSVEQLNLLPEKDRKVSFEDLYGIPHPTQPGVWYFPTPEERQVYEHRKIMLSAFGFRSNN